MCSKPCTAVAFRRGCSCHARAALVRHKVASSTRPIMIIVLLPVPIIGGFIPVQTENLRTHHFRVAWKAHGSVLTFAIQRCACLIHDEASVSAVAPCSRRQRANGRQRPPTEREPPPGPCGPSSDLCVPRPPLLHRQPAAELHGQALRISYFQPAQQFAEPGAALVLEAESDLVGGVARLFQLGDSVHERTTAKSVVGKAALELIEISQDLLCRG